MRALSRGDVWELYLVGQLSFHSLHPPPFPPGGILLFVKVRKQESCRYCEEHDATALQTQQNQEGERSKYAFRLNICFVMNENYRRCVCDISASTEQTGYLFGQKCITKLTHLIRKRR